MIMITVTILALVLVYKSFCNTVCIYMVMQIKLVVVLLLKIGVYIDGVQKGSRRGSDWVQMGFKRGSSEGSRLRGPRFVPTRVK